MKLYYFNGIQLTAIVRQYCEENVLNKEKRCDLQQAYNKVKRVSHKIRVIAVGCSPSKVAENPLVGNVILYIS